MTDHTKQFSDAQMAAVALQRQHGITAGEAAQIILNDPSLDVAALAAQERQTVNAELDAEKQRLFAASPEGRARAAQEAQARAAEKATQAEQARALLVEEGLSAEAAAELTDVEVRQMAGVEALPFDEMSQADRWRAQEGVAHMDGFEDLSLDEQQRLASSVGSTRGEILRYRESFVGGGTS